MIVTQLLCSVPPSCVSKATSYCTDLLPIGLKYFVRNELFSTHGAMPEMLEDLLLRQTYFKIFDWWGRSPCYGVTM